MTGKKLFFTLIFIAVGAIVAISKPFAELQDGGVMVGAMIAALGAWIFRPGGGTYIAGAAIIILGGAFAQVPMSVLTSGFASAPLWLLIPAMFLGYALLKTGFAKRMIYALFKRFQFSYAKILIGWFAVGVALSLLTPSISVRFLILTPIALSVADACRLERQSRGRSLIVISAWAVSIFPGIAWPNGSLFGPVFVSFLPESVRGMVCEATWFRAMSLPWLLFSALFLVTIYYVLRPAQKLDVTRAQISKMYDELGAFSSEEKGCFAAVIFLMIGFAAQIFFPITTNQILLAAFILMLLLGVFTVRDISVGINWDLVAFFGALLSLPAIFDYTGINLLLAPQLALLLQPITSSPLLFMLGLFVICALLRFIDVSQGWLIAALFAISTPMLYNDYGLHPLYSIVTFVCASCIFLFRYNQPWVAQAESVCGDAGWNKKHLRKVAIAYLAMAMFLLVFCRFYWGLIGVV